MKLDEIKLTLKKQLQEDKIEEFYKFWEEYVSNNCDLYEDYILLKSRERRIERQYLRQLILKDQYYVELGKIRKASIQLVKELEEIHLNKKQYSGIQKALIKHFQESKWNLYSFNQEQNTITVAILKIYKINFDQDKIILENPKKGYPYEGIVNFIQVEHDIVQFELINKRSGKSHIQLKFYFNPNKEKIDILLGQMLYTSFSKTIKSSNAILHKVTNNQLAKKRYFKYNSNKIEDSIKLFINPNRCTLRRTPFVHFSNLNQLMEWLSDEENQKKYFFKLL